MLDDTEEAFDEISLAIERKVAIALNFPVGFRRDDDLDGSSRQTFNEVVGVVTLVGKHSFRLDKRQQRLGLGDVVDLTAREAECQRIAEGIDDHVDFRRQPAARTADSLIEPLFFSAPALC